MSSEVLRAVRLTGLLAILLCGVYPTAVWIIGRVAFHERSSGGVIYKNGQPVGAKFIGQAFSRPEYFHGRPSAAGYDAANSSGSNLASTNKKLFDRVRFDVDRVLKENSGLTKGGVPVDLVTASASGLDPHISPEAARVQISRVARARGLSYEQVKVFVEKHTEGRQWGIFGEAIVNVLMLNLELDGNHG